MTTTTARIKAAIRAWKTALVRAEEAAIAGEKGRAVLAEIDAAEAAWGGVENAVRNQAMAAISLKEFKKVAGNEAALTALIGRKMAAVVGRPDLFGVNVPDWGGVENAVRNQALAAIRLLARHRHTAAVRRLRDGA